MTDMTLDTEFVSDDQFERFHIKWGLWAVLKICADPNVKTVLDIGTGAGEHARLMRHFGKEVYTNDWKTSSDFPGDVMDIDFKDQQFDAILCSHVLEHQRNVGLFLDKIISLVQDDGMLALAVPNHSQHAFITGHVTAWSLRLVAYNLMQAGVNCHEAQGLMDNECTFIARKNMIDMDKVRGRERSWAEHNKISGEAEDDTTTIPWHDDMDIFPEFLPFTNGNVDTPETKKMNWNGEINLPMPMNEKDIQILTGKQKEPVTIFYEALKKRVEGEAAA